MKYVSLILLVLLFAGCDRSQGDITITGTATGANFGHVTIRDQANNNVYSTDISAGKFNISKRFLQYSGYYKLVYSLSSATTRRVDIFLQPGEYSININPKKINNYPLITSLSKKQTELSAYYTLADSINAENRKRVIAIHSQIEGVENQAVTLEEHAAMTAKLHEDELNANRVDELTNLNAFINKYPENEIAPHIMLQMDYQNNPTEFYTIFQKLSSAAKSSDDGKELESKLKPLANVSAGTSTPTIAGKTPDGKTLDIKAMNKKIILLDFWRSTNGTSRDNHQYMITGLLSQFGDKGFGIVSISFDTEKNRWTTAITGDKMTWPQISDLKGDDSPNADSWGIKSIPAYCLLDSHGQIIEHVKDFNNVAASVANYLKTH
ncbi:TlpA disulfide reductase family protein [Mucilaginibacter sp.]|uniref:TlpA family protein disulfide reductase n=1 Tax=Mucilaginibacter sp. TaxID=1882438 RepID=UPI00260A360C|nr:TlpA disulfide reductase family protein [Mucilaginibacter sp.]MDB5031390.1 hypothetical protein [Mucilaginibacter sp.]